MIKMTIPSREEKMLAKEKIIDNFNAALDKWLASDDHKYSCAAYSEGQSCCLDKDERGRIIVCAYLETVIFGFMDFVDGLANDVNEMGDKMNTLVEVINGSEMDG